MDFCQAPTPEPAFVSELERRLLERQAVLRRAAQEGRLISRLWQKFIQFVRPAQVAVHCHPAAGGSNRGAVRHRAAARPGPGAALAGLRSRDRVRGPGRDACPGQSGRSDPRGGDLTRRAGDRRPTAHPDGDLQPGSSRERPSLAERSRGTIGLRRFPALARWQPAGDDSLGAEHRSRQAGVPGPACWNPSSHSTRAAPAIWSLPGRFPRIGKSL